MITAKNEIAQMFDDLPETAKEQIQKRDGTDTPIRALSGLQRSMPFSVGLGNDRARSGSNQFEMRLH